MFVLEVTTAHREVNSQLAVLQGPIKIWKDKEYARIVLEVSLKAVLKSN